MNRLLCADPGADLFAAKLRGLCRTGVFEGATAVHADKHLQTNLMIVPQEYAYDLLLFCQRNPRLCPLLEVFEPGDFEPHYAIAADLRSDVGGYYIFEHGVLKQEVDDISAYWGDDLVSFLIAGGFSLESALVESGIALRHLEQDGNVAMYKTDLPCVPAGRFSGNAVVSMRAIKSRDIARMVEITARLPQGQGAPLHIGNPQALGIADLMRPDFGDASAIMDDELPVFWACGVTLQYVAELSKLPFCITHARSKMFVTDQRNE